MEERPKTVPEIRGHTPIPKDRTDAYSAASYAAQYGITTEDAEELIERHGSRGAHPDIHRAILRMFSEDAELKRRALNPWEQEERKNAAIRAEITEQRTEERRKRIEESEREEAARKRAAQELREREATTTAETKH